MNLHANARTCPNSRELLARRVIERGMGRQRAAKPPGSPPDRRQVGGALRAGASRWRTAPRRQGGCRRTPRRRSTRSRSLRRLRMTAVEIAEVLGMALSTVSRWLQRIGLGKRTRLEPPEPPEPLRALATWRADPRRHQEARADRAGAGHRMVGHRGARGGGGALAEPARLGVRPRLRRRRHPARLRRGAPRREGRHRRRLPATGRGLVRDRHGITLEAVLSDNGACYRSDVHAEACAELGMRHLFTRPYRPRTNGKAERFIQTLTNRWAYGAIYGTSAERARALPGWLDHYNFRRPTRLPRPRGRPQLGSPSWNNVVGNYS